MSEPRDMREVERAPAGEEPGGWGARRALAALRGLSLRRLLGRPRTWLLLALCLIATAAGVFAEAGSRDRGLTRESLWLMEAVEQRRVYHDAFFVAPGEAELEPGLDVGDPGVIERTFAPHSALPPLTPALITGYADAVDHGGSDLEAATRVSAILFALFVLLVGVMGLEAGGAIGALVGAVGAATIPRLFALASAPGFGMCALLTLTLGAYLLSRASRSRLATLGAIWGVAAALLSSIIGLFLFLPWLFLTLGRPRVTRADDGFAATPPVPLRVWLIVPLGLALGFVSYPYLWFETKDHVHLWLTHFLRQPADPFSYGGQVWGPERLPWHAGPFLLAVTTPPAYLLLALAGWRGGALYERLMRTRTLAFLGRLPFAPRRRAVVAETGEGALTPGEETLRLAKGMLVFALVLPLVVRSPSLGGVDLIALALPWVLVFAASGIAQLTPLLLRLLGRGRGLRMRVGRAGLATVFTLLLLAPPMLELVRYHPLEEAYYNWIIGGPQGARRHGLPRYYHGPLPRALLERLAARAPGEPLAIGFLLPGHDLDRALSRMIQQGAAPEGARLEPSVYNAPVVILPHDDLDPRYEDALDDFYQSMRGDAGQDLITYERDAVPIFSVIAPRR